MMPSPSRFTASIRISALLLLLLAVAVPRCRAEQIPNPKDQPGADPVDLTPHAPATPPDPRIKSLIEQLGAADTVQREDAEKVLLSIGKDAVASLKAAETSPNLEIATRAKRLSARLADVSMKVKTYADVLPSDAVLFLEFRDAPGTLERMKKTPLGQFWADQSTKTFFAGYRATLLDSELKVLDSITNLPKLASGKAVFALSSPDTIEAHEIDPPLLYILETKNMQSVDMQIRNMFAGMNDEVKSKRDYKGFQIDEQNNASTVFGAERLIHALTTKGMESFLDNLRKPPAKPLSVLLADLKAKRPAADAYLRLNADGLKSLAEASQILDEELFKMIETAGFTEGGYFEDALTLNPEGVEEFIRFSAGGDTRNKGFLALLQRISVQAGPPLQANQPQALDMIPFQAAVVVTFNGDVSKHALELSSALKALDALSGTPIHVDAIDPNLTTLTPPPKPGEAVKPPRPPSKPLTPAEEALNAGGGDVLHEKKDVKNDPAGKEKDGDKKAAKADKAEFDRSMPHIERLRSAGFLLEELLAQADGPVVLALFPQRVEITKLTNPTAPDNAPDPDRVPMDVLFGMYLKNPAVIEAALEKANKGINPLYTKQTLNGGTFYAEDGDENTPGFWLRGNYFAYGSAKGVIEMAGAAVLNQAGTERMSARKSYLDYMENFYDPNALLNFYGDSRQLLEMPYKMAQLQWQDNPKNPWPDYKVAAGLLTGNTIRIRVKQKQGGLQIESQSPLSLVGLLFAMTKPLKEASLIQFP